MPAVQVLLNERAGAAKRESAQRIADAFTNIGADASVAIWPAAELAEAARRAARNGRTVVAAGGDGTVSTIAAAAAEADATFGVIPLGTLNHFAKDAGIPLDVEAAVRTIVEGRADRLDIAEANGHPFVNNASAGFYARIVRERQLEQRRGRAKWTAFAVGLARAWYDYRPLSVRLTIDGTTRTVVTPFVFVGNGDFVTEGIAVGRRCSIAGGKLSVFVAPHCTRGEMLAMTMRAVAGRLTEDVPLEEFRAREVTIDPQTRRTSLATDGELISVAAPIRCVVRPGALRTLRPAGTA